MPIKPGPGELQGIAAQLADLCQEKNDAYGNAFHLSDQFFKILYPGGIQTHQYQDALTMVRVFDKMMRIATRKDAFGESPWKDILGYALLSAWGDQHEAELGPVDTVQGFSARMFEAQVEEFVQAKKPAEQPVKTLKRIRYSWDCEFLIRGKLIDLISIGVVSEDGREFYAVVADLTVINSCFKHKWPGMVTEVLGQLPLRHYHPQGGPLEPGKIIWDMRHPDGLRILRSEGIMTGLRYFMDPQKYGKPEFWGYYGADDWNCLRDLFGGLDFNQIPEGWPHHFNEIRQLIHELGDPDISVLEPGNLRAHHALNDAKNQMRLLKYLDAVRHHNSHAWKHGNGFVQCANFYCRDQRISLGLA